MIDHGKKNILGVLVDAVDYAAAEERILTAARARRSMAAAALAVHGVMTGVLDKPHRYRLNHLDLVVSDGQPVRWTMNLLYRTHLPDRVYGPTLMLRLCERAAQEGLPIYLYGSQAHVVEALSHNLKMRFPGLTIAGAQPSLFRQTSPEEKQDIAREIHDSGAAMVFVGLGCPRQETWAYEYRDAIPIPLVAVGAAFDFHAGFMPQAPAWMQQTGLEWVFRLVHEPRRLWRRYLLLNPLYLILLALQITGLRRFDPAQAIPPDREVLHG
jgi:exopolysaccharide biosynthesis WecB/TagA/CpsF family protein